MSLMYNVPLSHARPTGHGVRHDVKQNCSGHYHVYCYNSKSDTFKFAKKKCQDRRSRSGLTFMVSSVLANISNDPISY
jgi:hypothetical protein